MTARSLRQLLQLREGPLQIALRLGRVLLVAAINRTLRAETPVAGYAAHTGLVTPALLNAMPFPANARRNRVGRGRRAQLQDIGLQASQPSADARSTLPVAPAAAASTTPREIRVNSSSRSIALALSQRR